MATKKIVKKPRASASRKSKTTAAVDAPAPETTAIEAEAPPATATKRKTSRRAKSTTSKEPKPSRARGRAKAPEAAEASEAPELEAATQLVATPNAPVAEPTQPETPLVNESDGSIVIRFPSRKLDPFAGRRRVEPEPARPAAQERPAARPPAPRAEPPRSVIEEAPSQLDKREGAEDFRREQGPDEEQGGRRRRRRRRGRRRGDGVANRTDGARDVELDAGPERGPAETNEDLDQRGAGWLEDAAEWLEEAHPDVNGEADEAGAPGQEASELEAPGERQGARRRRRRRGRRRGRGGNGDATHAEPVEAGGAEDNEDLGEARDLYAEGDELSLDEFPEPELTDEEGDVDVSEPVSTGVRKEMIINVSPREECRIAILEDGKLEEIYLERASAESHVGNIYKGVITNIEPSIQAAFVDFGLGKNGFLHISDLHPQYFPKGEGLTENVGRKTPRRSRPPIQHCLRRGQTLLVQITKEGIGTKGPTLTTYLSVPGRFLVMMPGMRQLGVSRKIEDDELRRKLRAQLNELTLPPDIGFIARTAAEGRTKRELQSDLNYLTRLWSVVDRRIKREKAPCEVYRDSELVIRTIRDVFTGDVAQIVVDDAEVAERAREFLSIFSPRARDIVVMYEGEEPIFHKYGIEQELERLHSRHVPLRSGGSLVIDQTEALVAIDVNSGRFRTEDDAETTAYKINLEAADEIPRQLRLRDLGGLVICDFIDMRYERHRREIERRLNKNLKKHKERVKVLRMSQFGIIELTRQRQRASLTRSVYQDCNHCRGLGLVKTAESVALDVMRSIQLAATKEHIRTIEVTVSSEVAHLLLNRKRATLNELENRQRRYVSIKPDPNFSLDRVEITCTDGRGRLTPYV